MHEHPSARDHRPLKQPPAFILRRLGIRCCEIYDEVQQESNALLRPVAAGELEVCNLDCVVYGTRCVSALRRLHGIYQTVLSWRIRTATIIDESLPVA